MYPRPHFPLWGRFRLGLFSLALLAGVACQSQGVAPQPATAVEEPRYGGILAVANRGEPPAAFDPMRTTSVDLSQSGHPVTGDGNLVKPCREDVSKICPALAESWQSNNDFTVWTFKVRPNVFWHDGTLFSAHDAKFWLDLAYSGARSGDKTRSPAFFKSCLGELDAVEVTEPDRVQIRLSRRSAIYAQQLAQCNEASMVLAHPRHLVFSRIEQGQVDVAPLDIGRIGTGPFKAFKYEKGSIIQVRRFDRYWEKDGKGQQLPYLDGIDFAIIPDPNAMDAAVRTGRVDIGSRGSGHYLTAQRKEAVDKTLGDKVWYGKLEANLDNLIFNTLRPGPWQDVRVRRAVALWIDKKASIQTLFGEGFGIVHPSSSPTSPWPNPDWQVWPGFNPATKDKDRAQAKQLLTEAGYPRGFKTSFLCPRVWIFECEWAQGELAPLGIELTLDLVVDDAARQQKALNADFEFSFSAMWKSFPEAIEPHLTRYSLSRSSLTKHEDPKVPEFFQRLSTAEKLEERIKIWRELERYVVLEHVYLVPIAGELGVVAHRNYVKGVFFPTFGPSNNLDFATVWLDK